MLATNPLPTGSPSDANTIGIVWVSCRIVSVAWFVLVTMTLGDMPTSSFAKARVFSGSPPPQRWTIWMFRFSTQPSPASFCRIAAT